MYVRLLALTALYWTEANVVGALGLVGYLIALLGLSWSPARVADHDSRVGLQRRSALAVAFTSPDDDEQ